MYRKKSVYTGGVNKIRSDMCRSRMWALVSSAYKIPLCNKGCVRFPNTGPARAGSAAHSQLNGHSPRFGGNVETMATLLSNLADLASPAFGTGFSQSESAVDLNPNN